MTDMLNAFPEHPVCGFCKDLGITFDELNGYRWCACAAGRTRQVEEPGVVDESNRNRAKLLALDRPKEAVRR